MVKNIVIVRQSMEMYYLVQHFITHFIAVAHFYTKKYKIDNCYEAMPKAEVQCLIKCIKLFYSDIPYMHKYSLALIVAILLLEVADIKWANFTIISYMLE